MKLATLLYIKNTKGDYLLLKRNKEPNRGLLSPPGGKVNFNPPESPLNCAVREAFEECGIKSKGKDWKLLGTVTENNYPNIGNILIFLYEYKRRIDKIPADINEGDFIFIPKKKIFKSPIPETDKLFIWKFVLERKRGIFSIYIDCNKIPFYCKIESE